MMAVKHHSLLHSIDIYFLVFWDFFFNQYENIVQFKLVLAGHDLSHISYTGHEQITLN